MYNKNFNKHPTDKQIVGAKGEDLVTSYLVSRGHTILDRNYYRKWGEIDIVSQLDRKIHFIEVKTVTRDSDYVTHVTSENYRAEDNMHPWKLERLSRVVQTYLIDKDVSDETEWQFDLVTVVLDKNMNLINIDSVNDIVL